MIIDLSEIEFTYNFFSTSMPNGKILIMNSLDEDFISTGDVENKIQNINMVIVGDTDEESILCSSVIGMGNDMLMLKSDYEEMQGKVLTTENMKYCTLELYEEDEQSE